MPKKGGRLGQFVDLRGGAWQERGGGVVFFFLAGEGADTSMQTMKYLKLDSFLNTVAVLQLATSSKKRLGTDVFL